MEEDDGEEERLDDVGGLGGREESLEVVGEEVVGLGSGLLLVEEGVEDAHDAGEFEESLVLEVVHLENYIKRKSCYEINNKPGLQVVFCNLLRRVNYRSFVFKCH